MKALRRRVLKFIFSDPHLALSRTHFVGLLLYLARGFAFSHECRTGSARPRLVAQIDNLAGLEVPEAVHVVRRPVTMMTEHLHCRVPRELATLDI